MPAILCANPSIHDYSEQETMLSNIQIQKQNAKREGKLPLAALTTHTITDLDLLIHYY